MPRGAALYFHYPCFDGLISCVLAWDYLESQGWHFKSFVPVNYGQREGWASARLNVPSAVVDFLYHPDAQFWADHHLTTFVNEGFRKAFERREGSWLLYDPQVGSCASLIWERFCSYFENKRDRYPEMLEWAERIDSARYSSVKEAIFGGSPALEINFSMMRRNTSEYSSLLLRALRKESLSAVAELPEVRSRYEEVRLLIEKGLLRFDASASLVDGQVVVFDLEVQQADIISRYAPFYRFPHARYSIGILRFGDGAKITAMRNPWLEFESVPMGVLFERYGGGGHQRVGAVILDKRRSDEAQQIVMQILSDIRKHTSPLSIAAQR